MNIFLDIASSLAGKNITLVNDTNIKLWSGQYSVSVLLFRENGFGDIVKLADDAYSAEVLIRHGMGDDQQEIAVTRWAAVDWNQAQFSALMMMLPSMAEQGLTEATNAIRNIYRLGDK